MVSKILRLLHIHGLLHTQEALAEPPLTAKSARTYTVYSFSLVSEQVALAMKAFRTFNGFGLDEISSFFLKIGMLILAEPLSQLFNLSLSAGKVRSQSGPGVKAPWACKLCLCAPYRNGSCIPSHSDIYVVCILAVPVLRIQVGYGPVAGAFPDQWKIARIVPIYKEGLSDIRSNCRPISVSLVISKLLERLVCNKYYNFLVSNHHLYSYQPSFR